MGEVRKAFVEFGDQIWAFVHRGPYAAFVVAGTSVRPGVLLDQLEQVLLAAEASRGNWEPLKVSDAHTAPSGKPRAPLHPPAERTAPPEPATVVVGEIAEERPRGAPERAPVIEEAPRRDVVTAEAGAAPRRRRMPSPRARSPPPVGTPLSPLPPRVPSRRGTPGGPSGRGPREHAQA